MAQARELKFQYPLRVLGCEKESRTWDRAHRNVFQYPLRVLGCEKCVLVPASTFASMFQYPLRVLGCEKTVPELEFRVTPEVSVPSAGSWL